MGMGMGMGTGMACLVPPQGQTQAQPLSPVSVTSIASSPSTVHSMPTPTSVMPQPVLGRSKTPTAPLMHHVSTPPASMGVGMGLAMVYPMAAPVSPNALLPHVNGLNLKVTPVGTMQGSVSPNTLSLPLAQENRVGNHGGNSPSWTGTGTGSVSPVVFTPLSMANQLARMQHTLGNMACAVPMVSPNNAASASTSASTQFQFGQSPLKSPAQRSKGKNKSKSKSKGKKGGSHSPEQQKVGTKLHKLLLPTFEQRTGKIVGMFLKANTCDAIRNMLQAHARGDSVLMTTANTYLAELRKKK